MSQPEVEDFGLKDPTPEELDATKERRKQEIRDKGDMQKVLSLVEGRRVIYKLLKESGIWNASFTQNSNLTAFNEGRRDRGLALLNSVMDADTNVFYQMHREYVSEINSKKPKEN